VSKHADNGAALEEAAFSRLDAAIGELADGLAEAMEKAADAERRNAELSEMLRRFSGDEDAGRLMSRLKHLEAENADLRARLDRGREGVDRMIARIRFLENQA
jgi:predicted nuclease with TOPRIM domain